MIVIRNLNLIKNPLPNLAITIGNFDGAHLGHLKIINQLKNIAQENSLKSAIITFEPHPLSFFQPQNNKNYRITSLSQKLKIFQDLNIDFVIVLKFNKNLSQISAQNFIEKILIEKLNSSAFIVGYDFTFGKNREGDYSFLKNYIDEKRLKFKLEQVSKVEINNKICSSSLIRNLIKDAKIKQANQLLIKNFTISGIVNEGKKLGRTIGFKTANLLTKPHIINPKFGVYKSKTFIHHLNKNFNSITNFGIKPSVKNDLLANFETHIFDFDDNLYGKKISIELIDFIREEKKFSNLDELKKQIKNDINLRNF